MSENTPPEMQRQLPRFIGYGIPVDGQVEIKIRLTEFQYETLMGVSGGSINAWFGELLFFDFMHHEDARVCSECGWECWPVARSINRFRFFEPSGPHRHFYNTEGLHMCPKCSKRLSKVKDRSPISELYGEDLRIARANYHYAGMDSIRNRLKKITNVIPIKAKAKRSESA